MITHPINNAEITEATFTFDTFISFNPNARAKWPTRWIANYCFFLKNSLISSPAKYAGINENTINEGDNTAL